jgi:CRP-like cAMP-binding protein
MESSRQRPPSFVAVLPPQEHRRLLDLAPCRRFARGSALFTTGEPAHSVHLVVRGRVVVRLVTLTGEQVAVEVVGPGETVGELAILADTLVRSGTVVAIEPVETRAIPATAFNELRGRVPEVAQQLLATLAYRMKQTNLRLLEALFLAATDRVRHWLGEMADLYAEDGGPVTVPLTQCELAELAGTSPETVNRVLRREVVRGTVVLGRSRIVVLDRTAFTRAAPSARDLREPSFA